MDQRRTTDFNAAFQLPARLAFWDRHPLMGVVPIVLPCDHGPFSMYLENDDTVVKTLYWAGFYHGWEPTSLRLWSSLAATCTGIVDVGAYSGIYGLLAATSNPSAAVTCFEASRRNFDRVEKNIAINGLEKRVRAIHAIVADTEGEATLYEHYVAPNILSSIHSTVKQKGAPTQVRSHRLDVVFADPARVDLIKIDVEGAEPAVLAGLSGIFERSSPHMLLEANSVAELRDSLRHIPDRYRCFALLEEKRDAAEVCASALNTDVKLENRNFLFTTSLALAEVRDMLHRAA